MLLAQSQGSSHPERVKRCPEVGEKVIFELLEREKEAFFFSFRHHKSGEVFLCAFLKDYFVSARRTGDELFSTARLGQLLILSLLFDAI